MRCTEGAPAWPGPTPQRHRAGRQPHTWVGESSTSEESYACGCAPCPSPAPTGQAASGQTQLPWSMLCLVLPLSSGLRSQTLQVEVKRGRRCRSPKVQTSACPCVGLCPHIAPFSPHTVRHRQRSSPWLHRQCGCWRWKPTNLINLQLQVGACSGGQRKCSSGASLPLPWNVQPPRRKPRLLTILFLTVSPNALTLQSRPSNLKSSLAPQISAKY